MVKKRASWLVVRFLGEMLTATAMGYFEGELEKALVLSLFIPLVISSGGNAGSQAATLVIRALALGLILGAIGFCASRCGRCFPTAMASTGCWWR